MSAPNAMENDKKRLRNQFTKDERIHLLDIMNEYGPLLDDKNISILSRKEIWDMIESKFNKGIHPERSSVQLKKYWQNYKYHSKRTGMIQKDNPKSLSPMTKQVFRMMAKIDPEEWDRYGVVAGLASQKSPNSCFAPLTTFEACTSSSEKISRGWNDPDNETNDHFPISLTISKTSPSSTFQNPGEPEEVQKMESSVIKESCSYVSNLVPIVRHGIPGGKMTLKMDCDEIDISRPETRSEMKESNVVVSKTDISGNSVTVSIICPEKLTRSKRILWTKTKKHDGKTANNEKSIDDYDNDDDVEWNTTRSSFKDEVPTTLEVSQELTSNETFKYGKMLARVKTNATLAEEQTKCEISCVPEVSVECSSGCSSKSCSICVGEGHRKNMIGTVTRKMDENFGNEFTIGRNESSTGTTKETRDLCLLVPRRMSNDHQVVDSDKSRCVLEVSKNLVGACAANGSEEMIREMEVEASSKVKSEENLRSSCSTLKSTNGVDVPRACSFFSGDKDTSELRKFLLLFAAMEDSKRAEVIDRVRKIVGSFNEESSVILEGERKIDTMRTLYKRDDNMAAIDSTRRDLIVMKHLLKPLANFEESTRKKYMENIRRCVFESVKEDARVNRMMIGEIVNLESANDAKRKKGRREVGRDDVSDSRDRNATLVMRQKLEEHVGQEVKAEMETMESNVTSMSSDSSETIGTVSPMDILAQAKLQSTKFELDHQLELQKLETEERRLKVKIAEMAVQETLLRIQSLNEDRRRAYELHELRLAQMAVKEGTTSLQGRQISEYKAKMNTSKMTVNGEPVRICPNTMFHSDSLDRA